MKVRAKFVCTANHEGSIILRAVMDGSEENKQFWNATPSGQVNMHITNPNAVEVFEQGKEYYVDFTPAPVEQPE